MAAIVRTLGWLACVVYSTIPSFWLMIHSRTDYWRARAQSSSPYKILASLWVAMWIVVAVATSPWRTATLYQSLWGWLPALSLFLLGFWLYRSSGGNFSWKQLAGVPELQATHAEQRLVTSGIRARLRHPVYLAHLCEMLAWSIGTGLLVCFALIALAVITGAVMIRSEDEELERRFGKPYREYRSRVPAVVPKLTRG